MIYDKSTALTTELFFKACIFSLHFKGYWDRYELYGLCTEPETIMDNCSFADFSSSSLKFKKNFRFRPTTNTDRKANQPPFSILTWS